MNPTSGSTLLTSLRAKTLVFTVTAGRSGTKLLATLLAECLGVDAEHEPAPRPNYVLRSIINAPEAASWWLLSEKLPAILARACGPVYVETSHLFCKGFIEPMLELRLRPKFIILTRPASEIAQSYFRMNVIPGRTSRGRLVLLGPDDPEVLHLPDAGRYSDYQLCYWYAREIERRQAAYGALFASRNLSAFRVEMRALLEWASFKDLAAFVAGECGLTPDEEIFRRVISRNQNSRENFTRGTGDREPPADLEFQERLVDEAIGANGASPRWLGTHPVSPKPGW